jgi:tRNA(Ile2) C34 agmatinyltransferase TiaS
MPKCPKCGGELEQDGDEFYCPDEECPSFMVDPKDYEDGELEEYDSIINNEEDEEETDA